MPIADARRISGPVGPVRNARFVDLAGADFEDPRGFVFTANADGVYVFRPESADADLTLALLPNEAPTVAGRPMLCTAVRMGAGLSIFVGNL